MYSPWAIPNDPRIALANMDAVFPVHEKRTLVAENVELDMETLRIAQSVNGHPLARHRAQKAIVESVIGALDPEDRKRFEAYEKGEAPDRTFECVVCGTTFKEGDGEHKNGYLVCPSCWDEDVREVTDGRTDNETK